MTKEEILAAVNAITLELNELQDALLTDTEVVTQAKILDLRQLIDAINLNIDNDLPNDSLISYLQDELITIRVIFDGFLVIIPTNATRIDEDSPVLVNPSPITDSSNDCVLVGESPT